MNDAATLPAGPRLPRPIQTVGWAARNWPWLEKLHAQYGDAFTLRIAQEPPFVVLADPQAVREVFTGSPEIFRAGEGNSILEPILGSSSVLLLDGREHLRQRRLLLPPFHGERLARQRALMERVAEEELSRWPLGTPESAQPRMQALTLEIILRVVLGVEREDPRAEQLRSALRQLLADVMDPRSALPIFLLGRHVRHVPKFRKRLNAVDDGLYGLIAARRTDPGTEQAEDVLALLLSAVDEDGNGMTDPELRDELLTLLVAGHETTATALAWALERLVRHPDALDRLRTGDEDYTDAVIKETLRLRPPLTIVTRKLAQPVTIAGHDLPAGVVVTPCIHLVHRRPDVYPDPRAFRPERFLERPAGTYTWIPFGGGVRRCLGAAFAEQEMRVVLEALVRTRRLRRPSEDAPAESAIRRTIVMAPSDGGRIIAAA